MGPDGSSSRRLPTWLRGRRSIGSALRATGADVFHATDPLCPWIGPARSSIVTVYDLIPLREPDILASWRIDYRLMYRRYLNQIRSASRVVAISTATASDIHDRLGVDPDRVDVVYPVVEPPALAERVAPPSPRFLVVGALDRHKQPDLALQAFARFLSASGSGHLHFIGPGAPGEVDRLQAIASGFGIGGSISIEGRISDEALEAAYRSATAVISTSRIEGFGLPPVEAVLRGVPVIAVDTAAARETLQDAAVIVAADAEVIAAAMARPRDPSASSMLAMRDRFSRATATRSLAQVYRRVLAATPGS